MRYINLLFTYLLTYLPFDVSIRISTSLLLIFHVTSSPSAFVVIFFNALYKLFIYLLTYLLTYLITYLQDLALHYSSQTR